MTNKINENLETPLISVIIPAYNVASWKLDKCLNSIYNQKQVIDNYGNLETIEIIVVDDGSQNKDELKQVVKKHPNNFKYILQEHSGVSKARNNGIHYASGKYITFVDADDFLIHDALCSLYKASDNGKAWMVIAAMDSTYALKKDSFSLIDEDAKEDEIIRGTSQIRKDLIESLMIPERKRYDGFTGQAVAQLIDRKFLLVNNINFDIDIKRCEDVVFELDVLLNIKEAECNKINILNKKVYYYIKYDDSTTHKYWANMWSDMKPLIRKFDTYKSYKEISSQEISYRFIATYYYVLVQCIFHDNNKNKEKEWLEMINDSLFKSHVKQVPFLFTFNILKIYAMLSLAARFKNYKYSEKLFYKWENTKKAVN